MDEYGITSFGVSVTTLEEVFMKVGEGAEKTVDDLYVVLSCLALEFLFFPTLVPQFNESANKFYVLL